MSTVRYTVIALLIALEGIAIRGVWIELYQNGSFTIMQKLRHTHPLLSSCPHVPLAKRYTGIPFIDDSFTGVECAWGTIFDGSYPALSLFAFQESGTFGTIAMLIWTESLKGYWEDTLISFPTFWLMAFQTVGFGPTLPIYCILHLVLGKTQSDTPVTICPSSRLNWKVLPLSITLGYVVPTILMSLTTFSLQTHRNLILAWGIYPFWVLLTQKLIVGAVSLFKGDPQSEAAHNSSKSDSWDALHSTYIFGVRLAALTHVWTWTFMFTCLIFPRLFKSGVVEQFTFQAVWIPPSFRDSYQVNSLAEGMLVLLQYDIYSGTAATIIWVWYLLYDARKSAFSSGYLTFKDILKTIALVAFLGKGAAVLVLVGEKDQILFRASTQGNLSPERSKIVQS